MKISIFWFRRDLRLEDNTALNQALSKKLQVLPVFIFDEKFYMNCQTMTLESTSFTTV